MPLATLEPLSPDVVHVGEPLPFDVFDQDRHLLLAAGMPVTSEAARSRLLSYGRCVVGVAERAEPESVFSLLDDAHLRAASGSALTLKGATRITDLAWRACALDVDAAVAWLSWGDAGPKNTPAWRAVAQAILGCVLQLEDARQATIGSLLAHVGGSESTQHPGRSAALLEEEGAPDLVLEAVLFHHEKTDGSGFPSGLKGPAIPAAARLAQLLIGLAQLMSEGRQPTECLRQVYQSQQEFDVETVARYIRVIGVYPAGSLVRLVDGSAAMVVRHTGGRYACVALAKEGGGLVPAEPIRVDVKVRGAIASPERVSDTRRLWQITNNKTEYVSNVT